MRIWIVIGMMGLMGCRADEPICLAEAQELVDSAEDLLHDMEDRMNDACEAEYGSDWFYSMHECARIERKPVPEVENCGD